MEGEAVSWERRSEGARLVCFELWVSEMEALLVETMLRSVLRRR